MDKKIEESKVIDYLYGELTEGELESTAAKINANEKIQSEVEGLSAVRKAISEVEDKEMIVPTFLFGESEHSHIGYFSSTAFRWVASIAASLLFLMVTAAVLKINIIQNDNGTQIGFGNMKPLEDQSINKEMVESWMYTAMNEHKDATNVKINGMETRLVSQMHNQDKENLSLMSTMMSKNTSGTSQMMKEYVAQLNDDNKEIIQNFFVVSSERQKLYVKNVLSDFNEFYQTQRSYDMKLVEKNISKVQNTQDVKQLEQDQLLASLYNIVNTQNK